MEFFKIKKYYSDYKLSEKNLPKYQELCKDLLRSPSVFRYIPPSEEASGAQNIQKRKYSYDASIQSPSKKQKVSADSVVTERSSSESPLSFDTKSLQKSFLSSFTNINSINVKLYKSLEVSQVCTNDSLIISDDVLIQVCKKSEKVDDSIASIIATLLILPKIYHLSNKFSPLSCGALCDYVHWHSKTAVMDALVPFLQRCPTLQEQHRDLVLQLTDQCPASLLTHLLRALSSRETVNDVDLQIFQHLAKKVDSEAENIHTSVLSFLGNALKSHRSSAKYGQCLLFIVKQMGPHIKDVETLQSVVDGHSSGMKKAIQIQLKKALKNR